MMRRILSFLLFFFFNDTATTEIYTLSLHDALPISYLQNFYSVPWQRIGQLLPVRITESELIVYDPDIREDRKSTRLNSSHSQISYAVFCLKKKKLASIPACLNVIL